MINPWKVLGATRKSTADEVRNTYMALAKETHPDMRKGSAVKFVVFTEAYQILKDKKKTQSFIELLAIKGKPCGNCKGSGVKSVSKSLTEKTYQACPPCDGMGYLIKQKEKDNAIELQFTDGPGSAGRNPKRRSGVYKRR